MRLLVQRLLLLGFGLLLSVLALELALRIGGVVVRLAADRSTPFGQEGGRVILCVGDSHTYGTGVPPEMTYPAWLEKDLQRVDPGARYQVVNLGVPGMNSAQVVDGLAGWLDEYEPDIVIVWSGLNNLWNRSDPGGFGEATGREWVLQQLGGLKVVRLVSVLQTAEFLTQLEEKGDAEKAAASVRANSWLFSEQRGIDELYEVTKRDHALMAVILGERDVPWVMMSYPRSHTAPVIAQRRAVTTVGQTLGVPVVRTEKALRRARKKFPRAQPICTPYEAERKQCLLVNAMGPHPTGALYSMIAKLVGEQVINTLGWSAGTAFEGKGYDAVLEAE